MSAIGSKMRLSTGLLIVACGSGESSEPAPEGPLVGTWHQTMSEGRVGSGTWSAVDDVSCRTDNVEEYDADGGWVMYDGTVQCGAGGTGIIRGTWRLAAGDTKVIYTYQGAAGEYESTIELLSDSDLILTQSTGTLSGEQTRNTYEKQ